MMSLMQARIRARRAIKPVSKRIPKQAHPLNIEREYARTLRGMMVMVNGLVKPELVRLFQPLQHNDASESDVLRTVGNLKIEIGTKFTSTRMGLIAQGAGTRTNKFNRVAVGDQIKAVIGVDPLGTVEQASNIAPILDDFVAENVSLIQSIADRYFGEVHAIVQDAAHTGKRADEVSSLIQGRFDVSQSRADLIARDQVSKLNGQLTQTRQGSLGISRYTWRTSLDERVRDTHAALEGQSFDWNSAPSVGHPGEDFQCRCGAEPDLSGLLGD